jgi:signal transduction histidine kinase
MNRRFPSLLRGWLATQLIIATLIIGVVSVVAWQRLNAAAEVYVQSRIDAISQVMKRASFPLTPSVLETISALTQSELAIADSHGNILASTFGEALENSDRNLLAAKSTKIPDFRVGWIELAQREQGLSDERLLAVFVPDKQVSQSRNQAAFLPIFTGAILSIAFGLAATLQFSRIVNRIQAIGRTVRRIGEGEYQAGALLSGNSISNSTEERSSYVGSQGDELTTLSQHIQTMSIKLKESEVLLRRTERDRTLSQISRGLSHDFKNTIAGVRLCIQSVQRENPKLDLEPLQLATNQLKTAEQLLHRVIASSIEPTAERQASLRFIILDITSMLNPMATHLGVTFEASIVADAEKCEVIHADLLKSAIFNLALNGIQAAGAKGRVHIGCEVSESLVRVEVRDNGIGVHPSLEDQILDPTITTKPEGLGLGLSIVRDVADLMGGTITWRRDQATTVFDFQFPKSNLECNGQNSHR